MSTLAQSLESAQSKFAGVPEGTQDRPHPRGLRALADRDADPADWRSVWRSARPAAEDDAAIPPARRSRARAARSPRSAQTRVAGENLTGPQKTRISARSPASLSKKLGEVALRQPVLGPTAHTGSARRWSADGVGLRRARAFGHLSA